MKHTLDELNKLREQHMPTTVDETLADREPLYGSYPQQAGFAQAMKTLMEAGPGWQRLEPYQRESMHMFATKISRILHGDPKHVDSWHDIAGYATLIVDELT